MAIQCTAGCGSRELYFLFDNAGRKKKGLCRVCLNNIISGNKNREPKNLFDYGDEEDGKYY